MSRLDSRGIQRILDIFGEVTYEQVLDLDGTAGLDDDEYASEDYVDEIEDEDEESEINRRRARLFKQKALEKEAEQQS